MKEGRRRYKLDQHQWICKNNHVVEGMEEGIKAKPCPECEGNLEDKLNMYLSSRLYSIGLDAGNGIERLFCKSGQPASIPYDQFLRCLSVSHGQAGSGIRRPAGVSVKYPCTNQCSCPSVDLKDMFPPIEVREIHVSNVADLLAVISQSQNPSVSFNPAC